MVFTHFLNNVRIGNITPSITNTLQKLSLKPVPELEKITKIFSHRREVDSLNNYELSTIKMPVKTYKCYDKGKSPWILYLKNKIARETLDLKEGAAVMLLKNLSSPCGLSNGTRGFVERFEWCDPVTPLSRKVCPVNQAGKIAIPVMKVDSILPSFKNFKQKKRMDLETRRGWLDLTQKGLLTKEGYVRIFPGGWSIEEKGIEKASRLQIPLLLAYAITIHKSQGMTLSSCSLSLKKSFDYGQVYVALSRCESFDGLYVQDFSASAIRTNQKCVTFYQKLAETKNIQDIKTKQGDLKREFISVI